MFVEPRRRTRCIVLATAMALSMLFLVLENNAGFVYPGGQRRSNKDITPDHFVAETNKVLLLHKETSGSEMWANRAVSFGVAIGVVFAVVNIPQRADALLGFQTFHHDDSVVEGEPRIWKRGQRAKELWKQEGSSDPTETIIGSVMMFSLSLVAGISLNSQSASAVPRVLDTTEDPERLQFESDQGGMFKTKRKGSTAASASTGTTDCRS